MERVEIRLECLRIRATERPGFNSCQLVEEARILENYVLGAESDSKVEIKTPPKKAATPNPLS